MFNKILLATDGSEHSIRAAEKAIALASTQREAQLDIIYVIDIKQSKDDVLKHWGSEPTDKRKNKLMLIEQKAKHAEVPFNTIFLHGEPGPTIVDFANKNAYDALVIGSRGLNAFQEMVLGSVSHKVAKRAKCPVMIVK
ncbi:universal stress protein [Rossellomorea aquimaris]|uniref:universal stress protein n=1 Tax=Rossellomorea aquimaris TaxID=189382 RepID=UPI001CD2E339|nr:universal stress protein [Rossellomorea aquimaris]MCA1053697.1 universal stress protein [Rossellomorea aquimaris]